MTPKRRDRKPGRDHAGDSMSPDHRPHTGIRAALRDLATGLLLTAVLVGAKMGFEHGEFGRQIEQMTVNLLQLRLARAPEAHDLPVVVVDITDVPRRPRLGVGDPQMVTDPQVLRGMIQAVAEKGPRAIGVDVLLDPPTENDTLTEDERALLEACLSLTATQHIKTFVGIFDGVVRGPDRWLGESRFRDLARYVLVPRPSEESAATSTMIRGLKTSVNGTPIAIESLSHAVAEVGARPQGEHRRVGAWLAGRVPALVQSEWPEAGDEFETAAFPVDFGALPELRRTMIRASNARDIAASTVPLAGKVVLMGRAETGKTTDVFTVPAQSEPVAGVLIHAAAAYTLMTAPLFRLTHEGRLVADVIAAVIPLGLVFVVSVWASHTDAASVHQLARVSTWTMALLVFGCGYVWIIYTGILWTDQLMVVAALLLHGPIERVGAAMMQRARGTRAAAVSGGH